MLRLRCRYAQHERSWRVALFPPFTLSVTAAGGEVEGRTQRIVLTWTRYYVRCANIVCFDSVLLLRVVLNAVARFRDRFTAAARAAARAGNTTAVTEAETTVLAFGRFQDEAERMVPRHGFNDVTEMVLDLPLRNPDDLSKSPR
ncbi:MAG TPA: hypothetical protein VKK81_21085 [Candidatus Binatia bacterium]|nr:hypothetical protein [Candidatus Binatia bacterium]